MGYFQSAEHVKQGLGGFFQCLADDPEMGPRLLASNLVLRFFYANPDASLTVDLSGDQLRLGYDETDTKADVTMWMEAQVAHRYWLGEIPLPIALARRQIRAKGPIPKILKLLPIIKKAHSMYPAYIEKS
jgi:hypothetical protein